MDPQMVILFWFTGLVAAALLVYGIARRAAATEREKVRNAFFPPEWEEILRRNLPLYSRMPEELRRELQGLVNLFLDSKNFEGCDGIELTDEIRVTIAAQACLLLLNRKPRVYPRLSSVLVYPEPFITKQFWPLGGHWVEGDQPAAGLSSRGAVVITWDAEQHVAAAAQEKHNVAVHEFAHQLDQEDGAADGIPLLESRSSIVAWARVVGAEFERLQISAERGVPTFLDQYGATNPAEFFAVATEAFIENPQALRSRKPELYATLRDYYRIDPAEWQ